MRSSVVLDRSRARFRTRNDRTLALVLDKGSYVVQLLDTINTFKGQQVTAQFSDTRSPVES